MEKYEAAKQIKTLETGTTSEEQLKLTLEALDLSTNNKSAQLEEAIELLKQSVNFLNTMPNFRKFGSPKFRDSYELASAIDNFLKNFK